MIALLHRLELRQPWMLLLALAALPVLWLAWRAGGRVVFSSLRLVPTRERGARVLLAPAPAILLALGAGLLGVAAAGPRLPDEKSRVRKNGIAIQMVLDVSGSMQALDLSLPERERTRLRASQDVLRDFVLGGEGLAGRPDDAIGLVSFARYADCRSPLTLDRQSLVAIADGLEIVKEQSEDGTALGDGLGLAVERLQGAKARSRVIILLTDGVNNAGDLDPLAAADLAHEKGIRVYTVGVGSRGFAPVRVTDPTGRSFLTRTRVDIDEKLLEEIARRTGGRSFRATDAASLVAVYREIDGLEKSEVEAPVYARHRELFAETTAAALGLVVLALLLQATWLRRAP